MGTPDEKIYIRPEGGASNDVAIEKPSPKALDSLDLLELGIKPQVVDRLLPHLDSFVKWELLRFFQSNPEMSATIDELARYTGRDETELKPAARALATAGIIHQRDVGTGYEYSLTRDDTLRHLINHLIQSYQGDRLVRHAISNQILRTQRQTSSVQFAM